MEVPNFSCGPQFGVRTPPSIRTGFGEEGLPPLIRPLVVAVLCLCVVGCTQVSPRVTNPAYPYPVYDSTPPAKAGKRF